MYINIRKDIKLVVAEAIKWMRLGRCALNCR